MNCISRLMKLHNELKDELKKNRQRKKAVREKYGKSKLDNKILTNEGS